MARKIFDVDIEGAYEKYQKKSKKKKVVEKPNTHSNELTDFFGPTVTINDYNTIKEVYDNTEELEFSLKDDYKEEFIRIENNRITYLNIGIGGIKTIPYGLEKLTGLKELLLDINEIEDISPLEKMKKLEVLTLSKYESKDYKSLTKLPNLKKINVYRHYFHPNSKIKAKLKQKGVIIEYVNELTVSGF